MQLNEIIKSYEEIKLEINYINERLVLLLNEIEDSYDFSPFDSDDEELIKIWNMISNARNYKIYKRTGVNESIDKKIKF
ncbi:MULTISPECIES: hypothetical protein [Clostridium]|uniref:hypothetical protein n=1 Tax=Clostridium TaxID=1485 RepID=UPI000E4CCB87|nr:MULTISPECIES: hypothetical protein [Clostridium]RGH15965.1 hypothetical protein DWV73_05910 [Clostridium sp. AF12-41]